MKKIVVISGSARKGGNSDLLAKAFIDGAQQSGNSVVLFEAGKRKLTGCTACNTCFSQGRACSCNDDFNELAVPLEAADTVVFCTPLYWFTFPAALKMVIDKLYAFIIGGRPIQHKEAMLIVCAETSHPSDFDAVTKTFELILHYLDWKNVGVITVPKVNHIGDVANTNGLAKARNLGVGIG
jgi:multimeric flavodoxin WrbA